MNYISPNLQKNDVADSVHHVNWHTSVKVGRKNLRNRLKSVLGFLCPRHEMAEGHIEFTLSVCVCVPESCPGHNLAVHDGI